MTFTLRLFAETEKDMHVGYTWYEEKAPCLGVEFEKAVYSSITEIVRNPYIYPKFEKEFRRCLTRKFPYSIYFFIEENTIIICGIFHCARNPEGIKEVVHNRVDND